MIYCAMCGRSGATRKQEGLHFHTRCVPRVPIESDFDVMHMSDNRIISPRKTIRDAMRSIQHPMRRLVSVV